MAGVGPGCVKTRTLFFKVEFWPRLGGNGSQEIFRRHREGTTKEKDSQQISRRSIFTQPGSRAAMPSKSPLRRVHPRKRTRWTGAGAAESGQYSTSKLTRSWTGNSYGAFRLAWGLDGDTRTDEGGKRRELGANE